MEGLMRPERILSVREAQRLARRVLPRVVFDYIDGGADDERTLRANEDAFGDIAFVPHMGVDVGTPELATTVLGTPVSLPVLLAPCGLVRIMHPDSAPGVARAAQRQGTISVLSTVAGASVEEVAAAAPGPLWFQLYAAGGRREAEGLVERARSAAVAALVITIDTPVLGNRERDVRNGVSPPLRVTPSNAVHLGPQVLSRPAWLLRLARDGVRVSRAPRAAPAPADAGPTVGAVAMAASPFTWEDVAWLRDRWTAPLVVKGVLTGADARRAVDAGADAVVVSNHGGRQLDGAPATLRVLPEIVAAVGGDAEVLLDGGIRRGGDIVKALALGARAVLVGRPYLYGLAVAGESGVDRVLTVLRAEMARTLSLLGCRSAAELDTGWVQPAGPASFGS
jgi:L-lactate dehydrogenase (cytochrome)